MPYFKILRLGAIVIMSYALVHNLESVIFRQEITGSCIFLGGGGVNV